MERCPFCGNQLITCPCRYLLLGYKYDEMAHFSGLPRNVYEHDLPEDERARWEKMLIAEGRVPYIRWPVICARCGALWPEMFSVPEEEWLHYTWPNHDEVLCLPCYEEIKKAIDAHSGIRCALLGPLRRTVRVMTEREDWLRQRMKACKE
jgi:hypothetical protein